MAVHKDDNIVDHDVLIIGAGISGISAAHHVQKHFPNKSYRILEGREKMGGTWSFFKYPGIRCDSYMYTFGFSWRPWTSTDIIVGANVILQYLKDCAKEYGIEKQMIFSTRVQAANWDSSQAKWILQATTEANGVTSNVTYRAPYIFLCTGYYNYENPYQPAFPNQEAFEGPIIHPQHWPDDLDYANKKIVVIGSGATAITLIPALAQTATHVTMLQRSPTYVVAAPAKATRLAQAIARYLGHHAARWYFIGISMLFYWFCRTYPEKARKGFLKQAEEEIGEEKFDAKQFTPRYNPWDERLCLTPDADFYKAIRDDKADVITDHIQEFTKKGIKLKDSGKELEADIIVTATGLQLLYAGGMKVALDNKEVEVTKHFAYKGFMLNSVPNIFMASGYTNASWTLKCDLTNNAACECIKVCEQKGAQYFQPETPKEGKMAALPLLNLQSGYVQRNLDSMPKQSNIIPWTLHQNYIKDKYTLQYTPVDDGVMKFYWLGELNK